MNNENQKTLHLQQKQTALLRYLPIQTNAKPSAV